MQNPIPTDEQDVIYPIMELEPGRPVRMLELGNKKNPNGVYKDYFVSCGIEHISVDWNAQDGALNMDLRKLQEDFAPGGKWHQYFDIVTNIGTTEHVIPQGEVWQNILNALKVGGTLASVTPAPGYWAWHQRKGQYPKEEFYTDLAYSNGLDVEKLFTARAREVDRTRVNVYSRFTKREHVDEVIFADSLIFVNNP